MNWTNLPATEKENYLGFHKQSYKQDLEHSEKNLLSFPKWSIISGYYSMHNITKLFLAYRYNIKISSPEIHSKTITALEHFIKEQGTKTRLLELLKEAKDFYYSAERLKEKVLLTLLKRGGQERTRSQYYTEDYTKKTTINPQKASYFLEKIVKPYVKLVEELMK